MFIGTPQSARGRTFSVVFVPGWPSGSSRSGCAKTRCCSMRGARCSIDPALPVTDTRADEERLAAAPGRGGHGALFERHPRLELAESRPRVPSFYVLDVVRATTGLSHVTTPSRKTPRRAGAPGSTTSAARSARRYRRHGARPGRAAAAAARPGRGPRPRRGPRPLSARAERAARRRTATERWSRWQPRWSRSTGSRACSRSPRRRWPRSASRRGPTRSRRCSGMRRVPTSSSSPPSISSRRSMPRRRCSGLIPHARQSLPRDPD